MTLDLADHYATAIVQTINCQWSTMALDLSRYLFVDSAIMLLPLGIPKANNLGFNRVNLKFLSVMLREYLDFVSLRCNAHISVIP